MIFLFLNQNICCGYSKEPSHWDGSFEHPKHMLNTMGKKIFKILCWFYNTHNTIYNVRTQLNSLSELTLLYPNMFWLKYTKIIATLCFKLLQKSWLQLRARNRKMIFLFLNQNICCGYSKEPSHWDGSFEHPKHMLNTMGKKIFKILCWFFLFI